MAKVQIFKFLLLKQVFETRTIEIVAFTQAYAN